MARKKLIKKRKRDLWPIWMLALVILIMLFKVGPTVAASDKVKIDPQNSWEEVVVQKGDTLWGIAHQYRQPKEDVRLTISRIQDLNELAPSEPIYPGQILLIPVKKN